jgi:hypothetical protein
VLLQRKQRRLSGRSDDRRAFRTPCGFLVEAAVI